MWNYGLPRFDYHSGFLLKVYNDFVSLAEYMYYSDSLSNRPPGTYILDIKYLKNLKICMQKKFEEELQVL